MPNNDMNAGSMESTITAESTSTPQEAMQSPSQENTTPQGSKQEVKADAGTGRGNQNDTILGAKEKETTTYDFSEIVKESGDTFDEEAANAFAAVCQETGLSQEQAQSIAKYGTGLLQNSLTAAREQVHQELVQEVKEWGDQAAKELGPSFDETVGKAAKAMNFIETKAPGFVEMLGVTGAGSHPAMIKALAAFNALLGEDGGKSGTSGGSGTETYSKTDFSRYR